MGASVHAKTVPPHRCLIEAAPYRCPLPRVPQSPRGEPGPFQMALKGLHVVPHHVGHGTERPCSPGLTEHAGTSLHPLCLLAFLLGFPRGTQSYSSPWRATPSPVFHPFVPQHEITPEAPQSLIDMGTIRPQRLESWAYMCCRQ